MSAEFTFRGLDKLSPEQQLLFTRFGRGPSITASRVTVHGAFESVADAHPEAVAAKHGGKQITYAELDAAANRLANYLIDSGLRPRERVYLVVRRSLEMLVSIFAILKTGCQYCPIDGSISSEGALRHMLRNGAARWILCMEQFQDILEQSTEQGVMIVPLGTEVEAFSSTDRPLVSVSPDDGVYAIYTTGSTGRPKGVDVMHKNVTNALLLEPGNLSIRSGSRVAQVLNIAFDMGAWEILGCLMNGGTLVIRSSNWEDTLNEVDTLISTPSILARYRRKDYPNIKTVVTGGESCPQALADEWAECSFYYNICGPTEITILNSAQRHVPGQPLSIGKPLPNTNVYILDEYEEPVAIGSKGTMWVGGAGVTRGYIDLPHLTAQRYKRDKFTDDDSIMFNTGDIASWDKDGLLHSSGRVDDQVKIKGFRVELEGVAAVIEEYPGITRSCATLIDDFLYGFYVTTAFVDEHDLDTFVRQHLPYYSVPQRYCYLATMPLNENGKVNKSQLAKVALRATRTISTASTKRFTSRASFTPKDLYHPARCLHDSNRSDRLGPVQTTETIVSDELSDFHVSIPSVEEEPLTMPKKNGFHGQRWMRHRVLIMYKKFFTFAIVANLSAAVVILYLRVKTDRYMMADIATATATNLTLAVLMRSEPVINCLFTIFCSVPTTWPLFIRRHCARIFHIGGIHSGCAIAATLWFTIFTIGGTLELTKPPELRCIQVPAMILTYLILIVFIAMAFTSHPRIRRQHHDAWEMLHRFGGWTTLILLWIQTFLTTPEFQLSRASSQTYKYSPPIWLLTIVTLVIVFPWLWLRKVPVRSEVLSGHAIRLHFDYTTPTVGTSVRIAERPLFDWHGFATITNADGKGFSLVVSNAGDFTNRIIDRAPSEVWVRGIPTCGVLRIATLFKSVVLVATGSGIGPCLAVVLAKKTPCRILWSVHNPEQTFGKEIVESVLDTDPKAIIHNTETSGKPDLALEAWKLWKESKAEAVCVISNKRLTTKLVYAMESRGIPAYGAIFDS